MLIYKNTPVSDWDSIVARPVSKSGQMERRVQSILDAVKAHRDQAVYDFTRQFDGVTLSNQFIIAERTPPAEQGRVYGAHFAWSHTWWAIGYPVAGWLGSRYTPQSFWLGGLIALGCWFAAITALRRSS